MVSWLLAQTGQAQSIAYPGALGAMTAKNPSLTEQQKANRIEKRELKVICGHQTRFLGSILRPKRICGGGEG